ncbi:MAG: PhnD/SsuA/transferrin family substrate-binding protein [Pseudomonadota bacterium]
MKHCLLPLSLFLYILQPAHADLILSGTPCINEQRPIFDKRYSALAEELSKALGEPVHYVAPDKGMGYAKKIREGAYDILLDGPHLAAWRSAKGIHQPVALYNLPLTFLVITAAGDIQSPQQLVGKMVCIQPMPNLSSLEFTQMYTNPAQEPSLLPVEDYGLMVQKILSGKCKAGVLNAEFYTQKLDHKTQGSLHIVYRSAPLPGQVLTVSSKIGADKRKELAERIIHADPAKDELVQAMNRVTANGDAQFNTGWVAVKPENLRGLDSLLVKDSYGWE